MTGRTRFSPGTLLTGAFFLLFGLLLVGCGNSDQSPPSTPAPPPPKESAGTAPATGAAATTPTHPMSEVDSKNLKDQQGAMQTENSDGGKAPQ